jgi:polyhydroxyalkanoate synthesis regulator phasin
MLETLKHTIYAGIGATVLTYEKIEDGLQDLVKKGRISAEEAEAAARKISDQSKKEFKEARSSLESMFEDLLAKAKVARQKDVAALDKRLSALEKELKRVDSLEKKVEKLHPSDS